MNPQEITPFGIGQCGDIPTLTKIALASGAYGGLRQRLNAKLIMHKQGLTPTGE
jgi:hypothetical protein